MDTFDDVNDDIEAETTIQRQDGSQTQARPGAPNQNTSQNTQSSQADLLGSHSSLTSPQHDMADDQPIEVMNGQRKWHPYVELHFSTEDIMDSAKAASTAYLLPKHTSLLAQSSTEDVPTVLYDYVYATKARGAIKQWYWLWNDLFSFTREELAQQSAVRRIISPEQIIAFAATIMNMKLADENNGQLLATKVVMRPLSCIFRYEIIQAWRYISRFDSLMDEVNSPEGPHIKQATSMLGDLWVPSEGKGKGKPEEYLKVILDASIGAWRARNPTTKTRTMRRPNANQEPSEDLDESEPTLVSESGEIEQVLVAESDEPSATNPARKARSRKPSKKSENNGLETLLRVTGLADELAAKGDEQGADANPKKKRATAHAKRANKGKQSNQIELNPSDELDADTIAQQAQALASYMHQPFTTRNPMNSPSCEAVDFNAASQQAAPQPSEFAVPTQQAKRPYKPRSSKQVSSLPLGEEHRDKSTTSTVGNDINFMVRTWSELTYMLPKQLTQKPVAGSPFTLSRSPIEDDSRQHKRIVMGRM